MNSELKKKVEQAVKLLQVCYKVAGEPLEIAYSGGKDSDVILELAKMSGIAFKAVYRNTTIDPPGTIRHCEEKGVEIQRPKKPFFQLVRENGLPSRFYRFCCSKLKELYIGNNVVMGIRKCESVKRSKRYSEPTECRFGSDRKHFNAIYPILEWSDEEELSFINERHIKLHPLYYRDDGTVDITRRLGCMCCPLASTKKRIASFVEYPRMVRQYIRNLQIYRENHPNTNAVQYFKDSYEQFVCDLFYGGSLKEFHKHLGGGMFNESTDYKKLLEDYFHIELPEYRTSNDKEE